jgi:hypothetical protein
MNRTDHDTLTQIETSLRTALDRTDEAETRYQIRDSLQHLEALREFDDAS